MIRLCDIRFCFFGLLFISRLLLIVALWIVIDNPGPVFYRQQRVGKDGKDFGLLKFRSMRVGADKMSLITIGDRDPRVTRAGYYIRKYKLDELPQLWNVLIGDMAFIGPRPERPYYIRQIMEIDPRYEQLYKIRPGVTSYATLYNGYTDTMEKMLRRLELDLYYLEHRSLRMDFQILFKTFISIVFGKKF